MDERKSVTFIYKYNDNWIGGTYYITNIIKSLMYLPEKVKPNVIICYEGKKECINDFSRINYPYISYIPINTPYNIVIKILNKLTDILFKKRNLVKRIPLKKVINLYPASTQWSLKNVDSLFFWIPDFQEKYLPSFFSDEIIKIRDFSHSKIKNLGLPVVFSSNNALDDFNKFYPGNSNDKYVLQFTSCVGNTYKSLSINELMFKFKIQTPYFIVSNQFWEHKNHMVVLKALKILRDANKCSFTIVFTGKEADYRNPNYIKSIKNYVEINGLSKYVLFLGFIDRDEQLQLMKHSIAAIQPSLFEGWSTVVEDTKAINSYILLSEIPLHREQISANCTFFNPNEPNELAARMSEVAEKRPEIETIQYDHFILKFGYKFLSILK